MNKYQKINYEVMTDTKKQYTENVELKKSICDSMSRQFMVSHDVEIPLPSINKPETNYVTSGKRSFEAAKGYKGKITLFYFSTFILKIKIWRELFKLKNSSTFITLNCQTIKQSLTQYNEKIHFTFQLLLF